MTLQDWLQREKEGAEGALLTFSEIVLSSEAYALLEGRPRTVAGLAIVISEQSDPRMVAFRGDDKRGIAFRIPEEIVL